MRNRMAMLVPPPHPTSTQPSPNPHPTLTHLALPTLPGQASPPSPPSPPSPQALEGEMPHRADTPMVDVRDCAAAHVAAAETAAAAGKRFLTSSDRAVTRARLLRLLRAKYPEIEVADGGVPPDPSGLRRVFCGKNLPLLGIGLRDPDSSILDMAQTMIDLKSAMPKAAAPHQRSGEQCSE